MDYLGVQIVCATPATQPLAASERLALPEHLVELDVRCSCERTRTLIENRSATVHTHNERGYNP